jgi:DNA-binding response OmpR family regulator
VGNAGSKLRILVVDDDPGIVSFLKRGLIFEGYDVDTASDGVEALAKFKDRPPDLVVLDVMMPGIDGIEVSQRLRRLSNTPILMLTAKGTVADRVAGLDSGADDYLVKPFAFEELLARVRALVRRGYQQKNPCIDVDDLRLDTAAQRVWRGGQEIVLTSREYALLEYLSLRAGHIVSRTDIWGHVYDFESSATSNVVDVYIGYLRKKLDEGRRPLIRTVRGRGYRLGVEP